MPVQEYVMFMLCTIQLSSQCGLYNEVIHSMYNADDSLIKDVVTQGGAVVTCETRCTKGMVNKSCSHNVVHAGSVPFRVRAS